MMEPVICPHCKIPTEIAIRHMGKRLSELTEEQVKALPDDVRVYCCQCGETIEKEE